MIIKKNIQFFTHLCLCCVILASAESANATNLAQLARAAHGGFSLVKKITKASAIVGGAYWLVRAVLNYRTPRYATATYPAVERLVVYTDGKVTVQPSQDGTMKVTHKYGASWRSDLPQIGFSERFDPAQNTLTVQGLLDECHSGRIQRFIQWLFRLQPKRTLHHIIEVPNTTNVEITTGNSDRYTHNEQKPIVRVNPIIGNITVHAARGGVEVGNDEKPAKLKVTPRIDPSNHQAIINRRDPQDTSALHQVEWEKEYRDKGSITIHTPGMAIVRNFRGDLEVSGTNNVQAERHPQNVAGRVTVNHLLHSYALPTALKNRIFPLSRQDVAHEQPFTERQITVIASIKATQEVPPLSEII